jgi:hypothetical protein
MKLAFCPQIIEKIQISSFVKICPVGAELFHADLQTDGHNEANSRVSQFLRTRIKTTKSDVDPS